MWSDSYARYPFKPPHREGERDDKRPRPSPTVQKQTMKRLRRQRPFLESVLKEANGFKRKDTLMHANADQINTVSEMVLNLLKKRIPIDAVTYGTLKRLKNVLREVGKRRNSLKRRREHLLQQNSSGFWSGLHGCFQVCWAR